MRTVLLIFCCLPLLLSAQDPAVARVQARMQAEAQSLLGLFSAEQRVSAQLPFDSPERERWSNLPTHDFARQGLRLGEMTDTQRVVLHRLLQTALSPQGYFKLQLIIEQDQRIRGDVLAADGPDTRRDQYGHDHYYFSLFGSPQAGESWGWRFEGHHLSLHVTLSPAGISTTPMFIGANPRLLREGPYAGYNFLQPEGEVSARLIASLDATQQARAKLPGQMPDDILTRTGEEPHVKALYGLPAKAMTAAQRDDLLRLVHAWVYNLDRPLAEQEMARIVAAGVDQLHFSWAGDAAPGGAKYYRIQGPACIIEYDNRSYQPLHVHSLWRNLEQDFGRGLDKRE